MPFSDFWSVRLTSCQLILFSTSSEHTYKKSLLSRWQKISVDLFGVFWIYLIVFILLLSCVPLSPCQSEDGRSQLYEYYFCCTDFNFIAFRAQICILQTCTFLCLVLVLTFYVSHLSEALSAKSASLWHFGCYCDELSILIVVEIGIGIVHVEITGQILKTSLMIPWSPNIENLWWSNDRDDDHCIADWEVQHQPIRIKNFWLPTNWRTWFRQKSRAKYWKPLWWSNDRDDDHCIADWEVQHRQQPYDGRYRRAANTSLRVLQCLVIILTVNDIVIIIATRPKPSYRRQGLASGIVQVGTFWDVLNLSRRASSAQLGLYYWCSNFWEREEVMIFGTSQGVPTDPLEEVMIVDGGPNLP